MDEVDEEVVNPSDLVGVGDGEVVADQGAVVEKEQVSSVHAVRRRGLGKKYVGGVPRTAGSKRVLCFGHGVRHVRHDLKVLV